MTDKIKKDKNGKYSLTINWKENPILATIMLTYDNAIDRSGIASYATRARFRIIGHTVTPQVKDVESKTFFSLPYNLSPNGHFPQSNRLMVDDNHEFIQYGFPADAGPVFFKWINQDEQDQSILEMLLLSALFGVGISGLIEMVLGRLQLKKPT